MPSMESSILEIFSKLSDEKVISDWTALLLIVISATPIGITPMAPPLKNAFEAIGLRLLGKISVMGCCLVSGLVPAMILATAVPVFMEDASIIKEEVAAKLRGSLNRKIKFAASPEDRDRIKLSPLLALPVN